MNVLNSYGTATPRYATSCLSFQDESIHVPIGACIATWHVKQAKRLNLRQIHSDVVTFIGICPIHSNLIATTGYCGEVRLWNSEWEPVSDMINIGNEKLGHALWSLNGKYLILCSEGREGLLTLIQIDPIKQEEKLKYMLTIVAEVHGCYEYACFDHDSRQVLAVWQQPRVRNHTCKAVHFDIVYNDERNTSMQKKKEIMLREEGSLATVLHVNENYEKVIIGFQDRSITILETATMKLITKYKLETSGILKCIIFQENYLLARASRGIGRWDITENGECKFVKIYEVPSVSGNIFYLAYAVPSCKIARNDFRVWIATDASLHCVNLEDAANDEQSICYHTLTCCGVDFSLDGNWLASGDFAGNVMLWQVNGKTHAPTRQCNVGVSVRALCCRSIFQSDEIYVYIGTLDGNFYRWCVNIRDGTAKPPERVLSMCDGITVIKWQHGQDGKLLALGTQDGTLAIVEQLDDILRVKLAIVAHKPIKENTDLRFGSIAEYSEVWSLAWSPCNQFIATCSEDQTTCIWNMYGEKMHMLTGHTTAVTSVEWRFMPSIGEILVTCADDCTVMVWRENIQTERSIHIHSHHVNQIDMLEHRVVSRVQNVKIMNNKNKWGLYHVFKTSDYGLDWHTITYLSLDKQGSKLACATQNGYIFIWDTISKELLTRVKMHNGSIEGLTWSHAKKYLASVSSDCTINIYEI
jgi:WD40 repeat protein